MTAKGDLKSFKKQGSTNALLLIYLLRVVMIAHCCVSYYIENASVLVMPLLLL
jgi:hypothetical protein